MPTLTEKALLPKEESAGGGFSLLYDPACCFCADFAAWAVRRSARIEAVPFGDPRARAWVPDEGKLHRSFHLVAGDGSVESGPDALPRLAELTVGRAAGLLLSLCPEPALRRIYRWVSERRWRGGSPAVPTIDGASEKSAWKT